MLDLAYAKLNLSLNVGNKQGQFHPIDSIVVSVDCFDTVSVKKCKRKTVSVSGCKNIPQQQNTAFIAASEFVRRFDTDGCTIKIRKRIPIGAGMGGSSADAASVLRCLCKLYGVDASSGEVRQLCADIGSDVNFLLGGGFARITGKGDEIQQGSLHSNLYFALTTFDNPLLTKNVYAHFDKLGCDGNVCDNDKLFDLLQQGQNKQAISLFANGLQRAATDMSDFALPYLQCCQKYGFQCQMTGSGSAFFVACPDIDSAIYAKQILKINGFQTQVYCTTDVIVL